MTWADQKRDVSVARDVALRTMDRGCLVHCVWTGQRLLPATLDIDHCLPWAAWPCSDLWNLLQTHPRVNRHLKRDRLPSAAALQRARDAVLGWWNRGYLTGGDVALQRRFADEVRAGLPAIVTLVVAPDVDEVFAAVALQRLRLHQDQQVPEWDGAVFRRGEPPEPQAVSLA